MAARPRVGSICRPGSTPGRGQFRCLCRKAFGSACRRAPMRTRCWRLREKPMACPDGADIAAASGTQALIQWLPYLAAPGPVAIVGPTYSEHAAAWRNAGHPVIAIDHLAACPESAVHAVVVNPNNPDGRVTDRAALSANRGAAQGQGRLAGRRRSLCRYRSGHQRGRLVPGLACGDLALVRKILRPRRIAARFCHRRARCDRTYHRGIGSMAVFRTGAVDRRCGARRSAMGRSHARRA